MDRYQDYVIKDGKFVGKFDEMYQKFDDPWHQSARDNSVDSYSRNTAIVNMRRFKIHSIVEFGCGLGHYTKFIKDSTGIEVKGVDISEEAIKKARKQWPQLDFEVGRVQDLGKYAAFDAVLFAEITWYILPDFDKILKDMYASFRGKYFFHNLVFYKGQQKYGREFFTDLNSFIDRVPFQLVARSEATAAEDDSIQTSTVFKIEMK